MNMWGDSHVGGGFLKTSEWDVERGIFSKSQHFYIKKVKEIQTKMSRSYIALKFLGFSWISYNVDPGKSRTYKTLQKAKIQGTFLSVLHNNFRSILIKRAIFDLNWVFPA